MFNKKTSLIITVVSSLLIGAVLGSITVIAFQLRSKNLGLKTPFIDSSFDKEKPLQKYAIRELQSYAYEPSTITATEVIQETEEFSTYLFNYTTTGKTMSGALNVPADLDTDSPPTVIVMIRGYAPLETYYSGSGTKNAAAVFARNGYVTIAPDFLGYGKSDPAPENTWQGRFEKPVQVIELIKSLQTSGVTIATEEQSFQIPATSEFGMWGHSNGGQITLSVVQGLQQPIPVTLWAPVLAPFPYSVLYFGIDDPDEGKSMRKYVSMLEDEYDVLEFTITQHLDLLTGPVQLHHGGNDADAPQSWSNLFSSHIENENIKRANLKEQESATQSASVLKEIDFTYYTYPEADHNMRPDWTTVVERDLEFFQEHLSLE